MIQFKVVNILQKRRKQIVEDEEARREAEEVARAAENFKNVDAELAEWEGKHGDGSAKGSSVLFTPPLEPRPKLPGFDDGQGNNSYSTLVGTAGTRKEAQPPPEIQVNPRRMSLLEEMGYKDDDAAPVSPHTPTQMVHDTDPEIEQKLQLLADVRRARQGVRSSMDMLRSSTHSSGRDAGVAGSAGSVGGSDGAGPSRPATAASIMDRERGAVVTPSPHSRANSIASSHMLDNGPRARQDSNASSRLLDERPRSRHLSGASSRLLDDDFNVRRNSVAPSLGGSFDDRRRRDSLDSRTFLPGEYSATELGRRLSHAEMQSADPSGGDPRRRTSSNPDWEKRNAEWEDYLKTRSVVGHAPPPVAPQNQELTVVSGGVARAISQRNEGAARGPERTPGQEYGVNLMRALSMDMSRNAALPPPAAPRPSGGDRPRAAPRAMTTEELAERHREKISRMQDRVSAPIREQIAVQNAREEWTKKQEAERREQMRRDGEGAGIRAERPPKHERGDTAKERSVGDVLTSRSPPRSSERRKRTEEWRQSVPLSPQKAAAALAPTSPHQTRSPPAATAPLPNPRASRRVSKPNINIA